MTRQPIEGKGRAGSGTFSAFTERAISTSFLPMVSMTRITDMESPDPRDVNSNTGKRTASRNFLEAIPKLVYEDDDDEI